MDHLISLLGIVAGGLTAIGAIYQFGLRPAYHFIRKIERANDLVLEFPEWQAKVNTSLSQLHPNGGSSLKDQVIETRADVAELRRMVKAHQSDHGIHTGDTGPIPIISEEDLK